MKKKKLFRNQAIVLHREMWNWIADEIEKRRAIIAETEFFLDHQAPINNPTNDSFLCEYASQEKKRSGSDKPHCYYCPLNWDSELDQYMCLDRICKDDMNGLYGKWCSDFNYDRELDDCDYRYAILLARKIASLEERKEDTK